MSSSLGSVSENALASSNKHVFSPDESSRWRTSRVFMASSDEACMSKISTSLSIVFISNYERGSCRGLGYHKSMQEFEVDAAISSSPHNPVSSVILVDHCTCVQN